MTLSFYLGWLTGCLTILAIAPWRSSQKLPKAITIGRDVPSSIPAAFRRRSEK